MSGFASKVGGPPFPRTETEWLEKGKTPDEAKSLMARDVFGHDYQTDKAGKPIERGKGSALQPTAQHQNALMISQEAEMARKMRLGWHPGMDNVFEPSPKARKRKAAKRKKAAVEPGEAVN